MGKDWTGGDRSGGEGSGFFSPSQRCGGGTSKGREWIGKDGRGREWIGSDLIKAR